MTTLTAHQNTGVLGFYKSLINLKMKIDTSNWQSFLPTVIPFATTTSTTTTTTTTTTTNYNSIKQQPTILSTSPILSPQQLSSTTHIAPFVQNIIEHLVASRTSTFSKQYKVETKKKLITSDHLRQAATQASCDAWSKDEEEDASIFETSTVNFTGRWRLNPSESDNIWSICSKLGAPFWVKPFVESSWFGLTTTVDHKPESNTWDETMVKELKLINFSFGNELNLDGNKELFKHEFDPAAKIYLDSFVEKDGSVVSVVEHCKHRTVQRMSRRLVNNKEGNPDIIRVRNVFSFVNEDGTVQSDVYTSNFYRE